MPQVLKGWFKKRGEGKVARSKVRWFEMSGHEIRFYTKKVNDCAPRCNIGCRLCTPVQHWLSTVHPGLTLCLDLLEDTSEAHRASAKKGADMYHRHPASVHCLYILAMLTRAPTINDVITAVYPLKG